jgi:hypothetical protein
VFCPVCHAEFIPGFTVCDECDVALVDELPVEPGPDKAARRASAASPPGSAAVGEPRSVELVTIFSSGDSGLVALVRSILTSAGIPCVGSGGVFGGGGSVRVGRDDAADAQALLTELEARSRRSATDDAEWDDQADEADGEWDEAGEEWDDDGDAADDTADEGAAGEAAEEGDGDEADEAGRRELSPGAGAPSPPSAPTPPPGVDPPAWRR